mgnify:CR=1 FL=1
MVFLLRDGLICGWNFAVGGGQGKTCVKNNKKFGQ